MNMLKNLTLNQNSLFFSAFAGSFYRSLFFSEVTKYKFPLEINPVEHNVLVSSQSKNAKTAISEKFP